MARSSYDYVTYIRTTPEKLWSALTVDAESMKRYWFGCHCESGWTAGSPWKMVFADGSLTDTGEILAAEPGRRLVIRWRNEWNPELKAEGWSQCTLELEPSGEAVKLSLTHSMERDRSKLISTVSQFWPQIICNLKSLLESGALVLQEPLTS